MSFKGCIMIFLFALSAISELSKEGLWVDTVVYKCTTGRINKVCNIVKTILNSDPEVQHLFLCELPPNHLPLNGGQNYCYCIVWRNQLIKLNLFTRCSDTKLTWYQVYKKRPDAFSSSLLYRDERMILHTVSCIKWEQKWFHSQYFEIT